MNRDQLLDRLKVDGCVENAKDCHFMIKQGLYRSWKTWKVMEFVNFISRPGKSWNLIVGPWKSWKIKFCLIDYLLQLTRQGQICKMEGSN